MQGLFGSLYIRPQPMEKLEPGTDWRCFGWHETFELRRSCWLAWLARLISLKPEFMK